MGAPCTSAAPFTQRWLEEGDVPMMVDEVVELDERRLLGNYGVLSLEYLRQIANTIREAPPQLGDERLDQEVWARVEADLDEAEARELRRIAMESSQETRRQAARAAREARHLAAWNWRGDED